MSGTDTWGVWRTRQQHDQPAALRTGRKQESITASE